MAVLRRFRALRPVPAVAPRVAAVPYDVVTVEEARALAAGNPLSFLHVSRAEIDLPPETDPAAPVVYERAATNFRHLVDTAPFVRDPDPALYCYRLRMGTHEQTGIAGLASLAEYDCGVIKKHERTRPDKEDDRMRHILAVGAQTGPVFLLYRASAEIDAVVARVVTTPSLVDFEASDGVRHTLWRLGPAETAAVEAAFAQVAALYIADGHHRAQAAARARDARRAGQAGLPVRPAADDGLLVVAFPHDRTQILPYNRIVKDLAGLTVDAFLDEVRRRCPLGPGTARPARRGEVSMFVAGRWYRVDLGPAPDAADPLARLDVSLLQDRILGPVLRIEDVRRDQRIDFVGGIRGTEALERVVTSGQAAVAFSLYPVSVEDLMAVADAGEVLPPKSTWFEPKLRDGLLVHLLDREG